MRSPRRCSDTCQPLHSPGVTRKPGRSNTGRTEPAGTHARGNQSPDGGSGAIPSGAHWFWTRVIPEMAKRLESGEELHLLVSPKSRHLHQGYGPNVSYITYPWSNERRSPRTLSEHLYSPVRLPLSRIDVFNTLMAPLVNISWSLVMHMKTMHAFTAPGVDQPLARLYRRMNYPRSARAADAIIINSESLRSEIKRYLDVDRAQAQADLRGGRPRPVPAGQRRRGPGYRGVARRD